MSIQSGVSGLAAQVTDSALKIASKKGLKSVEEIKLQQAEQGERYAQILEKLKTPEGRTEHYRDLLSRFSNPENSKTTKESLLRMIKELDGESEIKPQKQLQEMFAKKEEPISVAGKTITDPEALKKLRGQINGN